MLPQQHVKDPGHSAKSAGGSLQLNMHAPYVDGFHEARSEMVNCCVVRTERAETPLQVHHIGGYSKNRVIKSQSLMQKHIRVQ